MSQKIPDITGLSATEVAERVKAGKVNTTDMQTSRSLTDILRANIFTRFNALLGVLLVVVLAVGSPADALFGLVIFINSAVGIIQEVRAKRTLDRLALLNAPTARVVRDGGAQIIPIQQVVLDDVLELQIGDAVPADARVLHSEGLEADEALLTGESDSINKQVGDAMLSGSIIVAGHGFAQTTAVGRDAYIYKISVQVKRFSRARSELVDGTNKLLGYMSWVIVVVAPLLIWGQITNSGNGWQEALVRSTAAIVGMIPEGLVLLTSLAFMLATLTLARRKVLVQQLPAVEGLARVDVVCLDKTGTLTEGIIVLDEVVVIDAKRQAAIEKALATFASKPDSPTLHALHKVFKDGAEASARVPFSSARKWSALTIKGAHWVMGAPEVLLDATHPVRQKADAIADSGKRVLVLLAAKDAPKSKVVPKGEPVALVVLSEKIRSDAKETLAFFAKQGVALKIISGDNPRTVGAVARSVGLQVDKPVDARMLSNKPADLATALENHNVFGRVNPDQKRAFVKALQSQGHVVAMTGDGVNDALALKDADIGIAMASGSQATKAIAELVLLDNKFAHLPHVLAEGRRVIANIERVANLFLIKNVYSLILALAVTIAAAPYPFLPRHLTVLSALTIGIPAFFLALAPNNQRYRPGFLGRVLRFAVPVGIVVAGLIFATYIIVDTSPAAASTSASGVVMVVGTWVLCCLARPLNWWKVILVALMPLVFAGLVAVPFSRELLNLTTDLPHVGIIASLGVAGGIVVELLWRLDQRRTINSALPAKKVIQ